MKSKCQLSMTNAPDMFDQEYMLARPGTKTIVSTRLDHLLPADMPVGRALHSD